MVTDDKSGDIVLFSACLMMKDREAILENCLRSLRELADEIVIVDTGSTDRTVEIANELGAKVFEDEGRGGAASRSFETNPSTWREAGSYWLSTPMTR